ncbi:MAG: hypothetical protein ACK4TA_12090 [Saprospiraceae bacterium]
MNQLDGVIELKNWLHDLVQHGLAAALARDPEFWEDFAARMVNAKLGGIARRIRTFKNWLQTDDAHERLLAEIGELYLFAKAFEKLDTLPPDFQQEVLTTAGATIKKETVLKQASIVDQWLVVGQTEGSEDNIRYRRTWLHGLATHETALLLDFAWRFNDFEGVNWLLGSLLQAEIAFYPGAYRQRALVKNFAIIYEPVDLAGYADWEVFLRQYADALAQNPWLLQFPGLLDALTPVVQQDQLLLLDAHRQWLPTIVSDENQWKILALSGGHPISLFGEWDGRAFTPLTVFADGRIIPL